MASQLPPSSPPTPTAITCLREIFLRLPSLPSLVRAAFACRAFRRAVRSSLAFRRGFRALHAPPLLALFLEPNFEVAPSFLCPWRRCDPDLVAGDFFDIRLSRHGDANATGWEIQSQAPSCDGYFILHKVSGSTKRSAAYSPLTQALDLYLQYTDLQLYTLPSEDGQTPSLVVCVIHERGRWERAAVFSWDTMKWQIFPKNMLPLRDGARTGRVLRGLIWWPNWMCDKIVVLDTTTFQFSLIDVPTRLMTEWDNPTYKLGETKDGNLCLVDIKDDTLVAHHFLTADDDLVVESWMLYKEFPLHLIVKSVTGCSMEEEDCHVRVKVVAVFDGFVYLSIFYCKDTKPCELYLSLCLETSEMSELFNDAYRYNLDVHPYIMAWPPSLLQSKKESETESTGDSVADDGPVGTEKASSLLVVALQSLSQALIDDGGSNKEIVTEFDAFLHPKEDEAGSLMSKITSFDAQLITARDRILRISA
ncbi:hypothetical protein ACQ4PT_044320 [Festuca glaucescens]